MIACPYCAAKTHIVPHVVEVILAVCQVCKVAKVCVDTAGLNARD